MPKSIRAKPDDSIRDLFVMRDGWLWWNPETAHRNCDLSQPLRYGNKLNQTVSIKGAMYGVPRLCYWFSTGEWPENVIHKDHDNTNNHIDNLMPGTVQSSNQHRRFDKRTYNITEYVRKNGKVSYRVVLRFKEYEFYVGQFDTESDAITAAITIRKLVYGDYLAEDLKELIKKRGL